MAVAGPDHAGTSVPALTEARSRKANDRPNAIEEQTVAQKVERNM